MTNIYVCFFPMSLIILYELSFSPFVISFYLQVLYKHKIVLFGGFYDTLREVRSVEIIFNSHFWRGDGII
jgi:hypothetical protein